MPESRAMILGLSSSLRNARFGAGSDLLIKDIKELVTREDLDRYLEQQAQIRLEDFVAAGRSQNLAFDEIYQNLLKQRSDQGLSNSEVVLAAGLWGANQMGCDIDHVGLSRHFPAHTPGGVNLDELKDRLRAADGILLSAPVYFGDRSSVAHDFIEMVRADVDLRKNLQGKVYAGISVGAKRNGGQETTLIYQLLDFTAMGMLGVGNDSETTSQYGGTAHAGDVGTVAQDSYGLDTSVGVGKRIGHVANLLNKSKEGKLTGALRVQVWNLQDADGKAAKEIESVVAMLESTVEPKIEVTVLDLTESEIHRCIACDICPTHVGTDEEYRCIVQSGSDALKLNHSSFLEPDAILIAAHSPVDRTNLVSGYQRFMERTRYLRRGDYVLSDVAVAPLIWEELGAKENLHLRMLTSMVRHHTVMTHPITGYMKDGVTLNNDDVMNDLKSFIVNAAKVATGSCVLTNEKPPVTNYKPVGYVLSTMKDKEQETIDRRELAVAARAKRTGDDALRRIEYINGKDAPSKVKTGSAS